VHLRHRATAVLNGVTLIEADEKGYTPIDLLPGVAPALLAKGPGAFLQLISLIPPFRPNLFLY
jgi:hypothetical protein